MNNDPVLVDGPRLSDIQVRRSLRVNIFSGALGTAWWAVILGMPLTMLLEALGASGFMMGAVVTLIQVSMVMQVPGALVADRLKARKPMWFWVNLPARGLWVLLPVLLFFFREQPLLVAQVTLVFVALSAALNSISSAAWWSWMADLVPDHLRARFWGARQSWTVAAYLGATWLSGVVLDAYTGAPGGLRWRGFELLFLVAAVVGVVDILVHATIPEPRATPARMDLRWFTRLLQPLTYPDFRRLTFSMGVYTFAMGLVSLGIVYLKRDFNVSYSQLSAITIAANLGTVLVGFGGGYVLQRIGGRAFGAIMLMLAPVISLIWFAVHDYSCNVLELVSGWPGGVLRELVQALPFGLDARLEGLYLPQVIWALLGVNFFAGVVHGGISLCQINMCGALAPKEGRTLAMAVHWCTVGMIGATGSLISGKVMDYFVAHPLDLVLPNGTPMSFFHVLVVAQMLILWGIALPLQLRLRRRSGEPDFAGALSRLIMPNPVRAVTNIYMLSSALTSRRRAAAVRTIGERRTAIAVSDLIEKLDDPSSDVREEAVFALGRIGSPEAIDALLQKFSDPNADLAPQIARALRQAPDPRSVDALVRKLEDPDRETRTESARALGAIGDRRAVPSLLELLEHTDDAKVLSASSEALARLGDLAAIYEIVPRMKEARNPVLRRSLAVAIGDLLGEREGFYRVLLLDQETRGSEVDRMLRELRRDIAFAAGAQLLKEGEQLQNKTREIQAAYEEERLDRCAEALFELAVGLAALNWGIRFGGDAAAFLPDLVWRDERFGVGVWYLAMLRRGWEPAKLGPVDDVEILLGLYFLYSRGIQRREPKHLLTRAMRAGWRKG